jgi:hypothetical protein
VTEQLGRRCALVILAAMTLAIIVGLIAWGPVTLGGPEHRYADQRTLFGIPHAVNVLANLPVLAMGLWGWKATRASTWPSEVRLPWQTFHLCVVGGSVIAAIYHAAPGHTGYVMSQMAMSAAFVLLSVGVLAERVSPRFGSVRGLAGAAALIVAMAAIVLVGTHVDGNVDLRPFLLLQLLPVLLIPTGALSLPGRHTRGADWMLILIAYAAAKAFDLADATIFTSTGWISGHSLMHLGLACAAGWMAYCAAKAAAGDAAPGPTQRQTSLNTAS